MNICLRLKRNYYYEDIWGETGTETLYDTQQTRERHELLHEYIEESQLTPSYAGAERTGKSAQRNEPNNTCLATDVSNTEE